MTDREDPNTPGLSSNVVSLEGHKKKPKAKDKSDKISAAMVCRMLSDSVRRSSSLPPFPRRYEVLRPKAGASIPLVIEEGDTVKIVPPQALADDILTYCDRQLGHYGEFTIKPRAAQEAAAYFLGVHPGTPESAIKPVRWADEPGLTYRRLPWARGAGAAPTWEKLLGRMSNNQAFIRWIGSLFHDDAYLHNYLWIYGEGGDGKGSINRFLGKVFGEAYCSKTAPTMDRNGTVDKFWAYSLIGKRLAVFPDCESATFTTSGLFKSLTGGDPIEVEQKGAMGFTVYLKTRLAVMANVKPAITSAKSDMRRIIYCEMAPTDEHDETFEDKLWGEGGAFLSMCLAEYEAANPNHGPIVADTDNLVSVIDENEQHLENFFNEYFQLTDEKSFATGKEIKIAAEEAWPRGRKTYHNFLAWLKRAHKIEPVKHNFPAKTSEQRYYGMGRKKVVHSPANLDP